MFSSVAICLLKVLCIKHSLRLILVSYVVYLLALYNYDAIKISRNPRPKQIGEMASLAAVRDALLISRHTNIIYVVEFACLYDANSSTLTFPYYKFERFDIDAWNESECWTELRFGRQVFDLLRENSVRKFQTR